MTPSEQRRAFERARRAAAQRRTAIITDTRTEILRQLKEAEQQIALVLAQQPEDASRWRLQNLQREVRRAMDEFSGDVRPVVQRGLGAAWTAGEQLVDAPLAAARLAVEGVQAINTRALEAMREFLTDKIKDIGVEAANRINTQLGLVVLGGQTPGAAISAVQTILGEETRERATTIVRTELNRAFSAAAQERLAEVAQRVPGMRKEWRRSGKQHARLNHAAIDGQVRDWNKPFTVQGKEGKKVELMYPLDPKAPPGETINCGCTMLPLLPASSGFITNMPRWRGSSADDARRNDERVPVRSPTPAER